MMFCVLKAPKSLTFVPIGTAAAGLMAVLSQFGAAAAEPSASTAKWGATLETEAEFAYRSVYEWSLVQAKRAQGAASRRNPPPSAIATPEGTPELPSRKAGAEPDSAPVERNDVVTEKPVPTGAPSIFGEPPAHPLALSLIGRPRNLGDVITTQVIGDEGQEAEPDPGPAPRGRGDQYCANIASAATDARFAWQQQQLLETEEQVKNRIADLEAKIAEYRKWLARRDEFSKKAESSVTDIYAKMRPDAAAQQLMALEEEMAAAVIIKLNPRVASAVMAEMDAKQAARLSAIISGAAKGPKGKPPAKSQDRGT